LSKKNKKKKSKQRKVKRKQSKRSDWRTSQPQLEQIAQDFFIDLVQNGYSLGEIIYITEYLKLISVDNFINKVSFLRKEKRIKKLRNIMVV